MEKYADKVLRLMKENKLYQVRYLINTKQTGYKRLVAVRLAVLGKSFPFRANVPEEAVELVNIWLGFAPSKHGGK